MTYFLANKSRLLQALALWLLLLAPLLPAHAQRPFAPGVWKAGELAIAKDGRVWISLSTGTKTVEPKAGATWKLAPKELAPPASGIASAPARTLDAWRLGVRPSTNPEQGPVNTAVLAKLVASLSADSGYVVLLPRGGIPLATTLDTGDKTVVLEGVPGATSLNFPPACLGLKMHAGGLRNLIILAAARDNRDGLVKGVRSRNGFDYQWGGLWANGLVNVENCVFSNFSGNGITYTANIADKSARYPYGTNASHAKVTNTQVRSCGGFAYFTTGDDANNIIFLGCDARDSGLGNFGDFSFLGDQFIGCMAHRANTWDLENGYGHYTLNDNNSHATVVACYGEGDSPPSLAAGLATVVGGIHENGWITSAFSGTLIGNRVSGLSAGGVSLSASGLRFVSKDDGSGAPVFLKNMTPAGGRTHYKLGVSEQLGEAGILEFFESAPTGRRAQGKPGVAVQWMYLGDVLHLSMNTHGNNFSFNQDLPVLLNYRPGDVIEFADREAAYCKRLVCVEAGQGNKARWLADGNGQGGTRERPALGNANYSFFGTQYTANDVYLGWHYWNTDMGQDQIWNGKAWVDALGRPTE